MNPKSTRLALPLLAVLIIMLLASPSNALANGGEWTWMSGADTIGQSGVYGVLGTPGPANVPGARTGSSSWIDGAGDLWLFGGWGRGNAGNEGWLNDLWRYDANGQWTWMSGANSPDQAGAYGVQGVPDPANVPGARYASTSWIDGAGNMWLFGGLGLDSAGNVGYLNDLWRYGVDGQWTWMSGANTWGQQGVYGAQGTPAPANVPGARYASISWIDSSGNLWLFGGIGRDSAGNLGYLNDLWRYDENGEWTWMSGANTWFQAGVYGAQGTPDPANVPGARYRSISWIDGAGNLWLFGGDGIDGAGNDGWLNDLWRYGVDGQWTWMSGANTRDQAGVYGDMGTPDPGNVPGARSSSISWIDGAGNLWLFSGAGFDSNGDWGDLNDLWRYGADGQWTWMSGADTRVQAGVYGTLGTPAPANVPGARSSSISWIDGAGNLWLFGGGGYDGGGNSGYLNDLWRYSFRDMIHFSCQNPLEDFEGGVPALGWSVVNNVAGGPTWGDIARCGPNGTGGGNWTNGLGNAACISASTMEPGAYDAELRTPVFSLAGYSESTLSFLLNYQNWGGIDRLDFDISTDGGATWTALRTYTTDQGAFQGTPGVYITTDLAGYLGEENLMLRWRYHWDTPDALGWYAQIDDAEFKCSEIPPTAVTLDGLSVTSAASVGSLSLLALPAAVSLALGVAYALRHKD